jgi:hypothetical protein
LDAGAGTTSASKRKQARAKATTSPQSKQKQATASNSMQKQAKANKSQQILYMLGFSRWFRYIYVVVVSFEFFPNPSCAIKVFIFLLSHG